MTRIHSVFILLTVLLLSTVACQRTAAVPTPNTQATIDAAVAATGVAQTSNQATTDAAVAAAAPSEAAPVSTLPDTVDAQVAADVTALPPPPEIITPISAEQYLTMTDEELAILVDQAVTAAAVAAEQSAQAASGATVDKTLTPEEVQTIEMYLAGTDEALAYVDELVSVYTDLYGNLATEAVAELKEIEQTLNGIEENTQALTEAVEAVSDSLDQGVELAEETINQIEAAAQAAGAQATEAQAQAQTWLADYQATLDSRIATAVAMPATETATDLKEAVEDALAFFTAGQTALADGRITTAELTEIAQQGANASAGLDASGLPPLQDLAARIEGITTQFARGDVTQAHAQLERFGASLGSLPDLNGLSFEKSILPDKEELSLPERPARPSR